MLIHFLGPLRVLIGEVVSFLDVNTLAAFIVKFVKLVLRNGGVEQVTIITDELVTASTDGALHGSMWEVPDHAVTGFAIVALDQICFGSICLE